MDLDKIVNLIKKKSPAIMAAGLHKVELCRTHKGF
ncbi:hypothetical protein DJ50_4465 [Bacillus cereus ATCC 10876]|nr:hypothetical protein DJ50_4465 [Bacillus cereus ATCC 10876]